MGDCAAVGSIGGIWGQRSRSQSSAPEQFHQSDGLRRWLALSRFPTPDCDVFALAGETEGGREIRRGKTEAHTGVADLRGSHNGRPPKGAEGPPCPGHAKPEA